MFMMSLMSLMTLIYVITVIKGHQRLMGYMVIILVG